MEEPEKIKIRHRPVRYEGIVANSAVAMALYESIGLGRLIDRRCRFRPGHRIMSPGMVVKALIGPTFNIHEKFPLYLVNKAYQSAPVDRLFGPNVEKDDLYDNALGRGLDALFDAGLDSLFMDCANLCVERFGFHSDVYHMDSTDISFYGVEKEEVDGAAVPRRNGHPKDLRTELLQYEMQVLTDSNRIIRYMKPYSGGTTDPVMDRETIEVIGEVFSEEERARMTIVADCKVLNERNLEMIGRAGLGFVTVCPDHFGYHAKERAIEAAIEAGMHASKDGRSAERGLWFGDLDMDVFFGSRNERSANLRFIVFDDGNEVRRRARAIMDDAEPASLAGYESLRGRRFNSEFEAMAAFRNAGPDPDSPYSARARPFMCEEVVPVLGRPRKQWTGPPATRRWWELEIEYTVSERRAWEMALRQSMKVLVTNLPRSGTDRDSYRDGVTDEGVLGLYNQEYKVEQSFRLMKSGIGMNSVYLHTPSRENAMMFVISIAVLLSNIADAVFRRENVLLDGSTLTMHRLAHELQTTLVTYSRDERALDLMGEDGAVELLFHLTDTLRINPQLLLGYLGE